ncbi:hypothetical protein FEM48_Zijuj10G0025800 [Ziziphus jujuba var. spinosa]|uniref:Uncharacterized protein n=1 Tax=Ziziphus jujuba var. spinosa TaxID=714518 RepID=A0A978UKT1_ZIZJJ|nr:hypothetical protein FEM48_Zijuj10G0025800 [Ziziphus jujuba var. spinosa]
MKIIADDLEAAGEFVHGTNFACYILGGLGPEFDHVSENLNSRLDFIDLTEVRSRLLAYESKLDEYNYTLSINLSNSHSANMISFVSHTGLTLANLVQPSPHGHFETSGSKFQFSGPNLNAGRGYPRARYAQPFQQPFPQTSFTGGSANPWTFFAGIPNTLRSGVSDNCLYNCNMRPTTMSESPTRLVAPHLLSYSSASSLSTPFSYGVTPHLSSSNIISSPVPQQSPGFSANNGVTHCGAPLSASIGMNSVGFPFYVSCVSFCWTESGWFSLHASTVNFNWVKYYWLFFSTSTVS